jgi:hypothetical protein
MAPPRPAKELYAELAAGTNPLIPTKNLWKGAAEVIQKEKVLQPHLQNKDMLGLSEDLLKLARQNGGKIPIEQLYAHQERIGLLLRQAQADNWPKVESLKRLYGATFADIDAAVAAGVPEAATLKAASQAARKEFATADLAELFLPGKGINTVQNDLVQVNASRLLDTFNRKVQTDRLFRESFAPEELQSVRQLLQDLTKLPKVPTASSTAMRASFDIGRGGLVYGGVHALTGDPTTAFLAAGAAYYAPKIVAKALMSDTGRALLRQVMAPGTPLGPQELATLATLGQQAVSQPTP